MGRRYRRYMFFVLVCMVCIVPRIVSADDRVKEKEKEYDFNQNKNVTISNQKSYESSGAYTWLKYKAAADGYLTVRISNPAGAVSHARGYLALYNSTKGTLLSSKSIFYNAAHSQNAYWHTFTFGMREKQEYYIRVRAENAVSISRTFTKTNDKSGALQSKALKLKKNKMKTGLIPAGISNTDWYKIKLTKSLRLRLYYNVKTSGCFRMTIYAGSKQIGVKKMYYTSGTKKLTLYQSSTTTGKKTGLNKGRYFLRIDRANSASSGYYKIKWN